MGKRQNEILEIGVKPGIGETGCKEGDWRLGKVHAAGRLLRAAGNC